MKSRIHLLPVLSIMLIILPWAVSGDEPSGPAGSNRLEPSSLQEDETWVSDMTRVLVPEPKDYRLTSSVADANDRDASETESPLKKATTRPASFQPSPVQPLAPLSPMQPLAPLGPVQPIAPAPSRGGYLGPSLESEAPTLMASRDVATQVTSEKQLAITGGQTLDLALAKSSDVENFQVRRRSQLAFEPFLRGYRGAQIYASSLGAYWTPVRPDLDSVLNKIDPNMIENAVLIEGPYGLRYGPGFAFMDIVRASTPRHADGFQSDFEVIGGVRTNGGQLYNRDTVVGGADDWGYRISYGVRNGSDYEAGNGLKIPSSYFSQDVWAEFGFDTTPHQHLEFSFLNLEQNDTEYPGQFFDVSYLRTYGFETRLIDEDPMAPWTRLYVAGWYNRTRYAGDTSAKSNPNFPVLQRVEYGLDQDVLHLPVVAGIPPTSQLFGTTQGAVDSSGIRANMIFGEQDETNLMIGTDFRYISQVIGERFDLGVVEGVNPFVPPTFFTNMPHARMTDPGVFAEVNHPITEYSTVAVGGRLDFVETTAAASDLRPNSSLFGADTLSQQDTLCAFYLQDRIDLNDHWQLTPGVGQAQRPNTLLERYADALFVSVAQQGFTRVIGTTTLDPERDWQVDLRLNAKYENFRGNASVYHAWVQDYVTFEDEIVPTLSPDARLFRYINTDLATLAGFSLYGEYDLTPRLTPFAQMWYVEGRDQQINAPLPSIPPLESTVGIRLHDEDGGRTWGVEFAARMVDMQDRLGSVHVAGTASDSVVIEEQTPGFTVWHVRSYWNVRKHLTVIAGVDNLFNRTYQEHLDLRLLSTFNNQLSPIRVLQPGISPFFSVNWVF